MNEKKNCLICSTSVNPILCIFAVVVVVVGQTCTHTHTQHTYAKNQ